MQIPKAARRKAKELFDASLDAAGRPEAIKTLAVADLLAKAAPRHAVQILKEFTRLVRLALAKHHAVIESAVPLEKTTLDAIFSTLKERDGGVITLETKVNASLIGGARVRLGSEVWDATVQSRIQNLASLIS
jgi:F-type H+-transporting ATPase subunit delta